VHILECSSAAKRLAAGSAIEAARQRRGRKRWTNRWKAALNAFDITYGRLQDLALVCLGAGERDADRQPVQGSDQVQPQPQK
jgi:hypothetical protein